MGTTTLLLALSAIVASTPRDEATVERVDLVELNHCFDEFGRPAIDQLIFYDWCTTQYRFQVRAWRMLKTPAQLPRPDVAGGYMIRWQDGVVLRQIYAKQFRETWTQYDPELTEREFLPKDKRRDLRKLAKTRWTDPPAVAGEPRESSNSLASASPPMTVTTAPDALVSPRTSSSASPSTGQGPTSSPANVGNVRASTLLSTSGAAAP